MASLALRCTPPATFALTRSKVCVPCDLRPPQHPAGCVVCICALPSPRRIPLGLEIQPMLERSPTSMSVHCQYVLHIFPDTKLGSVKVKIIVKANRKRLNIFRSVAFLRVQNVGEISAFCISQRLQSEVQIRREKL